jgi:hypothetical protein
VKVSLLEEFYMKRSRVMDSQILAVLSRTCGSTLRPWAREYMSAALQAWAARRGIRIEHIQPEKLQ